MVFGGKLFQPDNGGSGMSIEETAIPASIALCFFTK